MSSINGWAVLIAAVASFLLGAIWYAEPVFGRLWQREAGIDRSASQGRSPALIFGASFALSFLAAGVFALFLGPRPSVSFAVGAGFAAGLAWVTASLGINYLFERKSLRLFVINGGFHTVQFVLYGLVLGLFH